ncbi:phage holin family protein [Helicobacter cappadocius]|uniref:Phage holin family protein n=1 Tax=Helicobacter cappadocius TaxID=3063998 RepID=A0AA90TCJ9_9HELI|nr:MULTISPECIES: phage holin family protein [unclassified Helicobacter]MDO7253890.1 phage holin family protein [Helicobacter sp. faydin-H75]MDP2539751.1 phage holin family protein [Helicobacter sp. faydin-H76]
MSFLEILKTYAFVMIIGIFVGCLFVLRTIHEEAIDTKAKMIQFIIYGVGSSMLITWIGYEVLIFYSLPNSLSCAIGGGLGFVGAETISRLIIALFKKKFGLSEKGENQ